jgi:hypothetical protein
VAASTTSASASFPRDTIRNRPQTLWRYREALPLPPACDVVSLGEALTPLLPRPALPGSRLKLEFLLPTGSFKDRGACVMLSHMKGLGIRAAVEDSSGNAAAAVAAYSARAGIACRIFVPASTSSGKLAQIATYGADLAPISGTREDVAAAARRCLKAGRGRAPAHRRNHRDPSHRFRPEGGLHYRGATETGAALVGAGFPLPHRTPYRFRQKITTPIARMRLATTKPGRYPRSCASQPNPMAPTAPPVSAAML